MRIIKYRFCCELLSNFVILRYNSAKLLLDLYSFRCENIKGGQPTSRRVARFTFTPKTGLADLIEKLDFFDSTPPPFGHLPCLGRSF